MILWSSIVYKDATVVLIRKIGNNIHKLLRVLPVHRRFELYQLLYVRVIPQLVRCCGFNGRQRFPRQTTVTVQLLQQELGPRNRGLRDGEIAPCYDGL